MNDYIYWVLWAIMIVSLWLSSRHLSKRSKEIKLESAKTNIVILSITETLEEFWNKSVDKLTFEARFKQILQANMMEYYKANKDVI